MTSRAQRLKLKLQKAAETSGQLLIEQFTTSKEYKILVETNEKETNSTDIIEQVVSSVPENEKEICKSLLESLNESSKHNKDISKYRHTFDENIKLYSLYIFLTAGRKSYEFLRANMIKALPSSSSVRNYFHEKEHLVEGKLDFDGLLQYLDTNNFPKVIFLSEDQTKLTKKIRYDKQTNCLTGFVSPTSQNGLPKPFYFSALSSLAIKRYF